MSDNRFKKMGRKSPVKKKQNADDNEEKEIKSSHRKIKDPKVCLMCGYLQGCMSLH